MVMWRCGGEWMGARDVPATARCATSFEGVHSDACDHFRRDEPPNLVPFSWGPLSSRWLAAISAIWCFGQLPVANAPKTHYCVVAVSTPWQGPNLNQRWLPLTARLLWREFGQASCWKGRQEPWAGLVESSTTQPSENWRNAADSDQPTAAAEDLASRVAGSRVERQW